VLALLSLISLGSSASAILKTISADYESTIGVQYEDGSIRTLNSQGGLFYAMGENQNYSHAAHFTIKNKDKSLTYDHWSSTSVYPAGEQSLYFSQRQDRGWPEDYYFTTSEAFEEFKFDWVFEVLYEDAFLEFGLNVINAVSANTKLSLTNLNSNEVVSIDSSFGQDLLLKEGDSYYLSLYLENSARFDGVDNLSYLRLSNAVFPIPAPNNILILLLALIALVPLRKSLK